MYACTIVYTFIFLKFYKDYVCGIKGMCDIVFNLIFMWAADGFSGERERFSAGHVHQPKE